MKNFFDLLIAILITITALPAVILLYNRKKRKGSWEHKNKKFSLTIAMILLVGTVVIVYGSFIEPRLLIVNKKIIDLDKIEDPIQIALITDLQAGPYKKADYTEKVVERVLKLKPDIVLLGGDHVDNNGVYDLIEIYYLKPLEKVAREIPTYAIHGNHEYGVGGGRAIYDERHRVANVNKEVKKAFENIGIKYLVNELEEIRVKEEVFYLFGADEWWGGKKDFSQLETRQKNIPTLMFMHNPAAVPDIALLKNIDLALFGHTHGGQIRLPFLGPLATVEYVPRQWHQGLHEYKGLKFFVTSGVGETAARARLLNPPEITLITLK